VFKYFQKISFSGYKIILGIVIFVLISVGILLYWRDSFLVEQAATKATQLKLLVLSRAGARTTERVLSLFKAELVVLERKEEIKNQDIAGARKLLTEILTSIDLPIAHQMGLISKDGVLLAVVNKEGNRENEGNSLADRDYFQWAKTAKEGEIFLSEPIIARSGSIKGQWVVALATPVIDKNGSFNGCLYLPIGLDDLTINYVDTLEISSTTVGYVISKDAVVLSSQYKDLIGVNIRDYAQKEKWHGYESYLTMINKMIQGEEGSSVYYFPDTNKKVEKWISSYSPIRIDRSTLVIATAVPFTWTYSLVADFYKAQTVWLAFIIIIGIAISFFWIVGLYLTRRDGYNRGLKDGVSFKKEEKRI
jgi:hypothetical protein